MRASRQEGGVGWSVAQAAGKPRTVEAEDRARAEHTPNIPPMAVTRDVSKLSGWLNAGTSCRVQRGTIGGGARHSGKEAGGRVGWVVWWRKQQGDPDCGG